MDVTPKACMQPLMPILIRSLWLQYGLLLWDLARLAVQFSEFRGSEFLDSQKGFAKVVAIAEAAFDGYRF